MPVDTKFAQVDVINSKTGKKTGDKMPVEILKVRRDHVTQEVQSVCVRPMKGKHRTLWVQPRFLSDFV